MERRTGRFGCACAAADRGEALRSGAQLSRCRGDGYALERSATRARLLLPRLCLPGGRSLRFGRTGLRARARTRPRQFDGTQPSWDACTRTAQASTRIRDCLQVVPESGARRQRESRALCRLRVARRRRSHRCDVPKARYWLREAANAGHVDALVQLARSYRAPFATRRISSARWRCTSRRSIRVRSKRSRRSATCISAEKPARPT